MSDGQSRRENWSIDSQLAGAAKEIWIVVWPAALFGFVGSTMAMLVGSWLFGDDWIISLFGVVIMALIVVVITGHRLRTLSTLEAQNAE